MVAEEKGAGQLNVMPSQGQTAWPGAEYWCEAELSSMPSPSGTYRRYITYPFTGHDHEKHTGLATTESKKQETLKSE